MTALTWSTVGAASIVRDGDLIMAAVRRVAVHGNAGFLAEVFVGPCRSAWRSDWNDASARAWCELELDLARAASIGAPKPREWVQPVLCDCCGASADQDCAPGCAGDVAELPSVTGGEAEAP